MSSRTGWMEIYLSMRRRLARTVSRIVPPDDVEDIVQETYVRLAQMGPPGHVSYPRSYLLKTARNLALDHVKRAEFRLSDSWDESEEQQLGGPTIRRDPTYDDMVSREEFARFCEAVRMLPVQCRRVFVLKKVYGYSQKEIARELGLAESTVEKHVASALARCAKEMASQSARVSRRHMEGAK